VYRDCKESGFRGGYPDDGRFLADVDTAFAWLPVGTPEDTINVIFYEYLGWCQTDFVSALVCICVGRDGVPRYCHLSSSGESCGSC
jgi:hypothetical protein